MTALDVVVVGGGGFIGARLCARLCSSERRFAIVDRGTGSVFPARSVLASVESTAFLDAVPSSTAIVNLAAEHRDDVRPVTRYREVNVGGAHSVCSAANRKGVRVIVFASSAAVYGAAPRNTRGNTSECAVPVPDSLYGQTKLAAEAVYRQWQTEDPRRRTLVIVRPTAVFGEHGGGNVNLLLSRIVSGRFAMVGTGRNVKSLAYVENVAAFLEFSLTFPPGIHVYNYVDKPDMTMNELMEFVRCKAGLEGRARWRIPYSVAYLAARLLDGAGFIARRRFAISANRVREFCADSQFDTSVAATGFLPPVSLQDGLTATVAELTSKEARSSAA